MKEGSSSIQWARATELRCHHPDPRPLCAERLGEGREAAYRAGKGSHVYVPASGIPPSQSRQAGRRKVAPTSLESKASKHLSLKQTPEAQEI